MSGSIWQYENQTHWFTYTVLIRLTLVWRSFSTRPYWYCPARDTSYDGTTKLCTSPKGGCCSISDDFSCSCYRKLNDATTRDPYSLPRIYEALNHFDESCELSNYNLSSGYQQVKMEEDCFLTQRGVYQFKVKPFGLCNAPATFEKFWWIVIEWIPMGSSWQKMSGNIWCTIKIGDRE